MIDVHPSLRRCLEKKSNSQQHRNEKTSLVAPRSCERSRSHHSANGQPASIPLSSPRWRTSWPPEEKVEARPPRRRGAALMGSGRERRNKRGRTQLDQPKRNTQTHKERKLKEPDQFRILLNVEFLAKSHLGTAENEPAKKLQNPER